MGQMPWLKHTLFYFNDLILFEAACGCIVRGGLQPAAAATYLPFYLPEGPGVIIPQPRVDQQFVGTQV
jgi:hypothetical protein